MIVARRQFLATVPAAFIAPRIGRTHPGLHIIRRRRRGMGAMVHGVELEVCDQTSAEGQYACSLRNQAAIDASYVSTPGSFLQPRVYAGTIQAAQTYGSSWMPSLAPAVVASAAPAQSPTATTAAVAEAPHAVAASGDGTASSVPKTSSGTQAAVASSFDSITAWFKGSMFGGIPNWALAGGAVLLFSNMGGRR